MSQTPSVEGIHLTHKRSMNPPSDGSTTLIKLISVTDCPASKPLCRPPSLTLFLVTYWNLPNLPQAPNHGTMVATEINSPGSDRCAVIEMKMERGAQENRNLILTGIGCAGDLTGSASATHVVHNVRWPDVTAVSTHMHREGQADAAVQHRWYLHKSSVTSR